MKTIIENSLETINALAATLMQEKKRNDELEERVKKAERLNVEIATKDAALDKLKVDKVLLIGENKRFKDSIDALEAAMSIEASLSEEWSKQAKLSRNRTIALGGRINSLIDSTGQTENDIKIAFDEIKGIVSPYKTS